MPRHRPPYRDEFCWEAIELARISSKSHGNIAQDLGISDVTLRSWIKQAERDEGKRPDGLATDQRAELQRYFLARETASRGRELLADPGGEGEFSGPLMCRALG